MVSPIQIRLLGAPQIEKDGQTILISRRKTLALLAYLAVTGNMHSREAWRRSSGQTMIKPAH